MKKDWEVKKLGEVCTIQLGKTPYRNNSKFWDKEKTSGNVWLSIADLKHGKYISESAEQISDLGAKNIVKIPQGTMLISFKLTLGRISFAGCDLYTNEAIASLLNLSSKINKDFLYYYFSLFNWDKAAEGDIKIKGKTLNKKKLNDLKVVIPPLPEQKRIVSVLDKCFTAINKAKANAEQNLKNAKEIFESYLQGVFKSGKWEKKKINQISENLDSKRIPITKNKRNSGNIPYYGASGIVDYVADYIFDDNLLCISEDGANLLARTYPIAFSITGKTWVNNHAHVLKFPNLTIQKFVELYINSIKIDEYVSGMAQPKLNQAMLNKIPIPIPSLSEQQSIVRQLDSLKAQTQKLETVYNKKIADLEELKKSILQDAFRGKLTAGAAK